jgi:hypothetical protein
MHSFTRRGRRSRRFPVVERSDVSLFLSLDETKQFEDLRLLRTRTAHLGGGSLAAVTAIFVSIILAVPPILMGDSGPQNESGAGGSAYLLAVAIVGIGVWLAFGFLLEQRDMARASARLTFYEEALAQRRQ